MKTIIEGHKVEVRMKGSNGSLSVDDHDLSQKIKSYSLTWQEGETSTLTIEYACHEQLTIDGDMEVVHVCPKKARK